MRNGKKIRNIHPFILLIFVIIYILQKLFDKKASKNVLLKTSIFIFIIVLND